MVSRIYLVNSDALDVILFLYFITGIFFFCYCPSPRVWMWSMCAPTIICLKVGLMPWFLFRQIDRDCEFLERERIMDYSLLIGVHFRDDYSGDEMKMSPFNLDSGNLSPQLKNNTQIFFGQLNCTNYCVLSFFRQKWYATWWERICNKQSRVAR